VSVKHAYDLWSASYDADHNITRDLDRTVTAQVLGTRRCADLLEIGCGTGKNTPLFAKIGKRVTAVDFSAGMLVQARAKITAPNVTFLAADITQPWPTPKLAFDLISCNLILEHIADLDFVMAQAGLSLKAGGQLFICELHPFKQYLGSQARFTQNNQQVTRIPAVTHHITDFLRAARQHGLSLLDLNEWWHETDADEPPRLISFLFDKPAPQ
jgi:malonyl-CoA O-methyltransferase